MNTRIIKISVLVFVLLISIIASVHAEDEYCTFDTAKTINVGIFSDTIDWDDCRSSDVDAHRVYRIWFDDPGYELNISVSTYDYDNNYNPRYIYLYDDSKNEIDQGRISGISGGTEIFEVITKRGWYYIKIFVVTTVTFDFEINANPPNPDKIKLSDINIVPKSAYKGETIGISLNVKNSGKFSDTCIGELIVDGIIKDTKNIEIDGGKTKEIPFSITAGEEGTHNVVVSVSPIWSSISKEVNGTYTVEHTPTPAEFEVSNLAIAPERVEIDDIVKITVDVANVGEVEGTYDVELHIDGRLEDSKMVTLSGGETKSVAFTIAEGYAGSYSIEVDDLSGAFEVVSPVSTPRATFTPKPTVKPASTSTQTSKPFTPTAHTKPVTPFFVRLDSINDVYIGENLIVTGTCNREEGYTIVVTCDGPVEFSPETVKIKNGKFKAIFDTNDAQIGTYIVNAFDGEENIAKTTVNIFAESIKPPTPTKTSSSASVNLYGDKTDVVLGEDILLRLSAVNLIIKPPMAVQVIIIPPSGMSVTSAEFAETVAGQYAATYKLKPGKGRDVEVRIKSNQIGDFVVEGRIVYYFGEDKTTGEDHTLTLPIKVRSVEPTPTHAPGETPAPTPPGFVAIMAIPAIAIVVLLLRRK